MTLREWVRDLWLWGLYLVVAAGVLMTVGPWRDSTGATVLFGLLVGTFCCLSAVGVGPEFPVRRVGFALLGVMALLVSTLLFVTWLNPA